MYLHLDQRLFTYPSFQPYLYLAVQMFSLLHSLIQTNLVEVQILYIQLPHTL